jgi:ketosteroid isomerase-like protein
MLVHHCVEELFSDCFRKKPKVTAIRRDAFILTNSLRQATSLTITAGSDVAFSLAAMRCTEPGANGGRQALDFRLTIGLRKIDGVWTITHEHHSVPAEQ